MIYIFFVNYLNKIASFYRTLTHLRRIERVVDLPEVLCVERLCDGRAVNPDAFRDGYEVRGGVEARPHAALIQ